jgi:predicted ABC-type sugar transport system permease subunit
MTTNISARPRLREKSLLQRTGIVLPSIAVLICAMALVEPRFFARANILNVLREFSVISIVSLGQAIVMIVGGFDLSVSATDGFRPNHHRLAGAGPPSSRALVRVSKGIGDEFICDQP